MHRSRPRRLIVAATLATGCLLGAAEGVFADATIQIQADAFDAATVTVAPGDKVTWANETAPGGHTATADNGSFDTGPIDPGQRVRVTFLKVGRFSYTCKLVPEMKGAVVVSDAALPTAGATGGTPPPTDVVPDARSGSGSTPTGSLLGLLLSILGLGAIVLRSVARRRSRGIHPTPDGSRST